MDYGYYARTLLKWNEDIDTDRAESIHHQGVSKEACPDHSTILVHHGTL